MGYTRGPHKRSKPETNQPFPAEFIDSKKGFAGIMKRRIAEILAQPGARLMVMLALLLLSINGLAVWGIVDAAGDAGETAQEQTHLQTLANARSLEAVLASGRSDFVFLTRSPPLADFHLALSEADPMRRRWRRLDLESTLLLFLAAHPEVQSLTLKDGKNGKAFLAAGRRSGAPALLPTSESPVPFRPVKGQLLGRWPLGDPLHAGILEAVLDISRLVELAAPAEASQLLVEPEALSDPKPASAQAESGLISASVQNLEWQPPIRWTLLRSQPESGLVDSISRLAHRYLSTLILNLALMSCALLLGVITFRQARRNARLEAENHHQKEVRELERQVLHQERLATIGQLAAGMAHEINNPLEGMSNYLRLLEDEVKGERSDDALQLIGRVREGLQRASGITRQVLTYADPAETPRRVLDMNRLVGDAIRFVHGNPAYRQVPIRFQPLAHESRVLGDPVTLGQLFLNLLLNACQQPSDTGEIEVIVKRREEEVEITFADQGPGIPEEILPRIFEPFFSTRQSTGLGLSVCLGIARRHGGRIEAANQQGGGALFVVHLPLHGSEDSRADPSSLPSAEAATRGVRE